MRAHDHAMQVDRSREANDAVLLLMGARSLLARFAAAASIPAGAEGPAEGPAEDPAPSGRDEPLEHAFLGLIALHARVEQWAQQLDPERVPPADEPPEAEGAEPLPASILR